MGPGILRDDWRLKLFSLGCSLILFVFVTVEKATPVDVDVRIEYKLADGVLILNDPPQVVHTTLHGPWAAFHAYDTEDVDPIVVDLTQDGLGPVRHALGTQMVHRPAGMRVESVRPTEIEVVLDRQIERQIAVHADLTGKPAYGYEVVETSIKPPRVKVTGPISKIQAIDFISTRPIDLSGRQQDVEYEVDLRPPAPPLKLTERRVSVFVEVAEEIVQRVFEKVPVVIEPKLAGISASAEFVRLVVKGPRHSVEAIDAHAFTAIAAPHPPADGKGASVGLRPNLPKDTWLVSWTPPIEMRQAPGKPIKRRTPP